MAASKQIFGLPRVEGFKPENLFGSKNSGIYEIIESSIGNKYSAGLMELVTSKARPRAKRGLWGKLITLATLSGSLRKDSKNVITKIDILSYVQDEWDASNSLPADILFNYYLSTWQFPHPGFNELRNAKIVKPYIAILIILNELFSQDKMNAYLTREEVCWLDRENEIKQGKFLQLNNLKSVASDISNHRINKLSYKLNSKLNINSSLTYFHNFIRQSKLIIEGKDARDFYKIKNISIGINQNAISFQNKIKQVINFSPPVFKFNPKVKFNDEKVRADFSDFLYENKKIDDWLSNTKLFPQVKNFFQQTHSAQTDKPFNSKKYSSERLKLKMNKISNLSIYSLQKKRMEQSLLRDNLFNGSEKGKCNFCQKEFPIDALVCAHIKPRQKCNDNEKKDFDVVMPACHFGCDYLYENGFILVDNGRVKLNKKKLQNKEIYKRSKLLLGNKVKFFNNRNKKYYLFHKKLHSENF